MTCLDRITLSPNEPLFQPIGDATDSHDITERAARMYTRFYGQETVLMTPVPHIQMLSQTLSALVIERPDLTDMNGTIIYTKTQTHNTPSDMNWLRKLVNSANLGSWDVATLSMTNCASALAAVHAFAAQNKPLIIMSGEKAFHSSGNRLAVGLLGEAPVAALFLPEAGRRVRSSSVKHLPRFFRNPDDMDQENKERLAGEFEQGLLDFLRDCIASDPTFFASDPVFVPYNLNVPLVTRVLSQLDCKYAVQHGHSGAFGHTFCSDPFLNMAMYPLPPNRSAFLFCAGMGVTYAAVSFENDNRVLPHHSNPQSQKEIL